MSDIVERLRSWAETRDQHDPSKQDDNPYERCALCHYTSHPCEVYELVDEVLAAADEIERLRTLVGQVSLELPGMWELADFTGGETDND